MNINQLHEKLHPKLKLYSGNAEKYSHRLSCDMNLTIERVGNEKWLVTIYERGNISSQNSFKSESQACIFVNKYCK